jgi:hypothetical protein
VTGAEGLDLGISAGLLVAEVIGWECEDLKAKLVVLCVGFLQACSTS